MRVYFCMSGCASVLACVCVYLNNNTNMKTDITVNTYYIDICLCLYDFSIGF